LVVGIIIAFTSEEKCPICKTQKWREEQEDRVKPKLKYCKNCKRIVIPHGFLIKTCPICHYMNWGEQSKRRKK